MKVTRWYNGFFGTCGVLVTAVGLALAPPCGSSFAETRADVTMGHGSAEDIAVAKVNGKTINMGQLMETMEEISRTKHGSQEISQLLAEKIKQEAIDKLVTEELAVQSASAKVKAVPPERLEAKIQAVRKGYKTEEEFQTYLKNQFGGMDKFRKQMERFVTIELFIAQEFEPKITVTDSEVAADYEKLKSELFVTDEFVQVNDLTFFFDPDDPESPARIKQITKTVVEQHHNDPRELPMDGTFTLEKNVPLDRVKNKELYERAKQLKEYGWSEPVNVNGNFHSVQLVGYKPAVNKSLKEATPYLTNEIKKKKRQDLLNAWMAGLKEGATIEIMDLTR